MALTTLEVISWFEDGQWLARAIPAPGMECVAEADSRIRALERLEREVKIFMTDTWAKLEVQVSSIVVDV